MILLTARLLSLCQGEICWMQIHATSLLFCNLSLGFKIGEGCIKDDVLVKIVTWVVMMVLELMVPT